LQSVNKAQEPYVGEEFTCIRLHKQSQEFYRKPI